MCSNNYPLFLFDLDDHAYDDDEDHEEQQQGGTSSWRWWSSSLPFPPSPLPGIMMSHTWGPRSDMNLEPRPLYLSTQDRSPFSWLSSSSRSSHHHDVDHRRYVTMLSIIDSALSLVSRDEDVIMLTDVAMVREVMDHEAKGDSDDDHHHTKNHDSTHSLPPHHLALCNDDNDHVEHHGLHDPDQEDRSAVIHDNTPHHKKDDNDHTSRYVQMTIVPCIGANNSASIAAMSTSSLVVTPDCEVEEEEADDDDGTTTTRPTTNYHEGQHPLRSPPRQDEENRM